VQRRLSFGPRSTSKEFATNNITQICSSSSSDNGADLIASNIALRVNKQMCSEKAVQQTMNSNLDKNSAV